MNRYLFCAMDCVLWIKRIIVISWILLTFSSISLLLACIVIGNMSNFHNIVNYLALSGIIGFVFSMIMLCACPLIREVCGRCNRQANHSQIREEFIINEEIPITKNEHIHPVATVATYVQDNEPSHNSLPIANQV
jgi:hypothetical protein